MSWIATGGLVVSAGYSYLKGKGQQNQANQIIAGNDRPDQKIPQAILDNQLMAKTLANQGLPSAQYSRAQQNIARNGTTALRGANDRRSGLMSIGTINKAANDATLGLDIADANAKRQNQQQLMATNNTVGQWENNVWDWNKRQKYLETAASARALLGARNANVNGAVDRAAAGAMKIGAGVNGWGKNTAITTGTQPPAYNMENDPYYF